MPRGGFGGRIARYGENKKLRRVTLTDIGWDGIDKMAIDLGVSKSEFLERLGRGNITLSEFQEIYKKILNRG